MNIIWPPEEASVNQAQISQVGTGGEKCRPDWSFYFDVRLKVAVVSPGGTPGNSRWGLAIRFSKSWPCFRPKHVIFHTRFQTRPLRSIPVFRPGLYAEIMLSLLRLKRKQKNSSNPFRIRIFLLLSYSFRIETINTFIYSHSSLENHIPIPDQKWTKCIPVFRPKRRKKPYPMGRHIPMWLI